jgi:hypothetical protein
MTCVTLLDCPITYPAEPYLLIILWIIVAKEASNSLRRKKISSRKTFGRPVRVPVCVTPLLYYPHVSNLTPPV